MAENNEILKLRQAIEALEGQRSILGDAVVETSLAALREKLEKLQLSKTDTGEQLRKFVTVLFADVSGFTSICRANDAENVTAAINTLWKALDTVIVNHGGSIDKHIGDCVMAVWGLDGVREDDPVRAVEAALAMQSAAEFFSSESDGLIPPFQIRIGVHSGSVFVSHIGLKGEYTVMGDTVNVASRLQEYSPLGSVIISHNTWKHARNDFVFRQQSPIKVKGIDEELDTYLAISSLSRQYSRLNVSVLGVNTVMVGREKELAALLEILAGAVSSSVTEMVTLVGEAGIGKSRLLHEFRHVVEKNREETVFFNARCTPGMIDIPCSVFRDILRFSFGVKEDDSTTLVFEKLESGMGEVLQTEEIHLACHFAGFDMSISDYIHDYTNDSSLASAGRTALVRYFRETARSGITLMYLEDLHWADSMSLELIEQIIQEIPKCRFFVFCLTRPPLLKRLPNWGRGLPNTFIHLKPLLPEECRALITDILQRIENLPAGLTELIIENADGNPFYVEELIKMLVEEEIICPGDWTVNLEALTERKIPSTLTGVLQARLDTLPGRERILLQMASVIGRVFWDKTVRELYGKKDPVEIPEVLSSVEKHDLVHRMHLSAFSDAGEYLFKHAILRDVTYETVLLGVRKKYHGLVACWLQKYSGDRISEFASLIADHYVGAEDWSNAIEWLLRSGKTAKNTSAYREALSRFRRALKAPDEFLDRALSAQLHFECGSCLEKLCSYDEAREELDKAIAIADQLDLHGVAAESMLALCWIMLITGKQSGAGELAQEAFCRAEESGDNLIVARAYMRLADFEEEDSYEKQIPYYRKAYLIYKESADKNGLAISLLNMGNVALKYDRAKEAEESYLESLSLYREMGNRWGIANCLGNLGCVASTEKEYEKACVFFRESLDVSTSIGDREGEVICTMNLGETALSLQEPVTALNHLRVSVSTADSVGLFPLRNQALRLSADALLDMNEEQKAALMLFVLEEGETFSSREKEEIAAMLLELEKSVNNKEFHRINKEAEKMDIDDLSTFLFSEDR